MYDANVNFIRERIIKWLPIYKYTIMTTNPRYVEEKYNYWYFLQNSGVKEALKIVCGDKRYTVFCMSILNDEVFLSGVHIPVGYGLEANLPKNLVSAIAKECNIEGLQREVDLNDRLMQLKDLKDEVVGGIKNAV